MNSVMHNSEASINKTLDALVGGGFNVTYDQQGRLLSIEPESQDDMMRALATVCGEREKIEYLPSQSENFKMSLIEAGDIVEVEDYKGRSFIFVIVGSSQSSGKLAHKVGFFASRTPSAAPIAEQFNSPYLRAARLQPVIFAGHNNELELIPPKTQDLNSTTENRLESGYVDVEDDTELIEYNPQMDLPWLYLAISKVRIYR